MITAKVFSVPHRHVVQYLNEDGSVSGYEFALTEYGAKSLAQDVTKDAGDEFKEVKWTDVLKQATPDTKAKAAKKSKPE